jgi:hypothetical protein
MKLVQSVWSIGWLLVPSIVGCSAGSSDAVVDGATQSTAEELRFRHCEGPLHSSCGPQQYCSTLRHDRCPGPRTFGVCAKKPELCSDLFAPVCGCDGETYPNSCFAAAAGVAESHEGACATKAPFCGGIAGIACPGFGKCVDDPSDSCDPNAGGADCGGICTCVETVLCVMGSHFDGDPSVCACVADARP